MFGNMFGNNKNEEASLYYLYMMADGNVSHSEEKLFDSICKDLNLDDESKKEVINKCKEMSRGSSDIFSVMVREKVDEKASNIGLFTNYSGLARIIWNLVNLGYADSKYSGGEKKFVKYLVDKWSISPEVLQEFVDTADTILALSKQKEWIATTYVKGTVRDKKEREVDAQINEMLEYVKLTIKEITM